MKHSGNGFRLCLKKFKKWFVNRAYIAGNISLRPHLTSRPFCNVEEPDKISIASAFGPLSNIGRNGKSRAKNLIAQCIAFRISKSLI